MRFPRISRLRWDKPPGEADRLETLERMLKTENEAPDSELEIAKMTKDSSSW
jgi:DNA ligase-1